MNTYKKVWLFIAINFSVSWVIALAYYLLGGQWNTLAATLIAVVYMFIPLVSAVTVQKLYHEPLRNPLGINFNINKWWIIALFVPIGISLLTIGINVLFPGISFSPGMEGFIERMSNTLPPDQVELLKEQLTAFPPYMLWIIILFQGLIAGVTINAVAGFGEEAGWRGFLHNEFKSMGFWKFSTLIGFTWGVWHAPLILQGHNYPQHPVIGVFMMIVWCILLGPIFSYIRVKSGSVIAAAILHGSLNAFAGLPLMLIKGGNDLTTGVTGLPGFCALFIIVLVIFLFDRSVDTG
ncbi:MAG: CPBP family intramembrane metalloprotease [Candidatus Methanofastidiosia archaeon]|jgi:membrane protease YdiL (CAAX protease family)